MTACLPLFCVMLGMVFSELAYSQNSDPSPRTVVFICQHGAAKSVIAAAFFNKLAAERRLNVHAIARGITPQPDLSIATVAGLKEDAVPLPEEKPRALSQEDIQRAVHIVAFCPLPRSMARDRRLSSFDVPEPKAGYEAARDAILVHVRALLDELASARHNAASSR